MRMPIEYGRPRVNAKPYRPNICADNYAAKYSAGPVLERARVSAALRRISFSCSLRFQRARKGPRVSMAP